MRTGRMVVLAWSALVAASCPGRAGDGKGPQVSAEVWKKHTLQGEPVILAVSLRNPTDVGWRLPLPSEALWLQVRDKQSGEVPPRVPSQHHMRGPFVLPAGRELMWHVNLWERYDLSEPGKYEVRPVYKWAYPEVLGEVGPGERAWEGELNLGSHEFEVLPAEGEDAEVYEQLKPDLPEIWRDTGAPAINLDRLAEQIAQDHPDSVYLPYLWWRFFYWYAASTRYVRPKEELHHLCREFLRDYPDFPMTGEAKLAQAFYESAPGKGYLQDPSGTIQALREFAARTDNLYAYLDALSVASLIEEYDGVPPGPF